MLQYKTLSEAQQAQQALGESDASCIVIREHPSSAGQGTVHYKIVTLEMLTAHANAPPGKPSWHEVQTVGEEASAFMDIDGIEFEYSSEEGWKKAKEEVARISKFAIRWIVDSYKRVGLDGTEAGAKGAVHFRVYDSTALVMPTVATATLQQHKSRLSLHIVAFCDSHYFTSIRQMLIAQWAALHLTLAGHKDTAHYVAADGKNKLLVDQSVFFSGTLRMLGSHSMNGGRRKCLLFSGSDLLPNDAQFEQYVTGAGADPTAIYVTQEIRDSLIFGGRRRLSLGEDRRTPIYTLPGWALKMAETAKSEMSQTTGILLRRTWPKQQLGQRAPVRSTDLAVAGEAPRQPAQPRCGGSPTVTLPHGSQQMLQAIAHQLVTTMEAAQRGHLKQVTRGARATELFDFTLHSTHCFVETNSTYCPQKGGNHKKNCLHYHTDTKGNYTSWCRSNNHSLPATTTQPSIVHRRQLQNFRFELMHSSVF
jgi:hypothetical protein